MSIPAQVDTDSAVRLRWLTAHGAHLARRLGREGIEVHDGRFRVGPVIVVIAAAADEQILHEPVHVAGEHRTDLAPSPGWAALAVAYATIDADRAAAGLAPAPISERPRDTRLGARVLVAAARPVPVALLEPDTEGRLAAMLARHGEGPVGAYLVRAGRDARGTPDDGPFGPQRLVVPATVPWAPVLLRVAPGAPHPGNRVDTIER